MKTKTIISAIGLLFLSLGIAVGQVNIFPEIGIAYNPLLIPFVKEKDKDLKLVLGVAGKFKVKESWFVKMRVSYMNRGHLEWRIVPFVGEYDYKLIHKDLNLDFSLNLQQHKNISFGLGPSFTKKIDSYLITDFKFIRNDNGNIIEESTHTEEGISEMEVGINTLLSVKLSRILISLQYVYQIHEIDFIFFRKEGRHRFDLTASYPIFKEE